MIAPADQVAFTRPGSLFVRAGKILCLICAGFATAAQSEPTGLAAPVPYDPSAYEMAPQFLQPQLPWSHEDVRREILQRVAREKRRREMDVYYYRIGYTMAFPLPLATRPTREQMPAGISNMKYPWLIWLSWDLEERWRILHFAWRQLDDAEAGKLLQQELAALGGWDRFVELNDNVGLVTAHMAASLSIALSDSSGWDTNKLRQARSAAELMIERDVWPWFEKTWRVDKWTPARLSNIPLIALARSAQLARVIGSARLDALDGRMREALDMWSNYRIGPGQHTEGVGYDGYLMDSMTEWLAALPDREQLLKQNEKAFRDLVTQAVDLMLPGRMDLQAPIGDVEPEMTHWATVLMRLAGWYQWNDAQWVLQRIPLNRMRAPAVFGALENKRFFERKVQPPKAGAHQHQNAVSLRTGWSADDLLATLGTSRGTMGHLHYDSGHVSIGWQSRFWIVDPGYQQYRPGDERDYTLGPQSHNIPVIGGLTQTIRAPKLEKLETKDNRQHAVVNLTGCYKGLPSGAGVVRDVWLLGTNGVLVRDTFKALTNGVVITTSWHGGTHLGWAFRQGWARLCDGEHALWIGTVPGKVDASMLNQHPGSRGPLTLTHSTTLVNGNGVRWWVLCCEANGGWQPPTVEANDGKLKCTPAADKSFSIE